MKKENDKISDEIIIKKIIDGDIDYYRLLVNKYQKHVFSMGMRFFRNMDEANDFTQEVFLKSYQNIKSFRKKAPFRFWLMKIAYNHGISRIKSMKDEIDISGLSLNSVERSPHDIQHDKEIRRILLKAIDRLPDNYKICLDLYFFLGLSFSDIGSITGAPVNTIKSNVHRAKIILRDYLKGTIAEDYIEMQ